MSLQKWLGTARLFAVLLLLPMAADAHGLLLDADTDGQVITGRVYYTNGDIAVGESLELRDLSAPDPAVVPGKTDNDGKFTFPVTAGHHYRVSAYGEEGHSVDIEIDAVAKARPQFVETETSAKEDSSLPPAWAVIGGLLVLSLVPVGIRRLRKAEG